MRRYTKYFKMELKEAPHQVEEIGNLVIKKAVFTISNISGREGNVIHINSTNKYPMLPDHEYIMIKTAMNETGFSESTLRRWCRTGKIDAKKVNNVWFLLKYSLIKYIKENK